MTIKLRGYIAFVFHSLHPEFLYFFETSGNHPDGYESNAKTKKDRPTEKYKITKLKFLVKVTVYF